MSVIAISQRIRKLINEPRLNWLVRQNPRHFNQLVSALDLLADTQYAIEAHGSLSNDMSLGERYLALYGVCQAFQMQQDAVVAMAAALGLPRDKAWERRGSPIKTMRKDVAGHPVSRADGERRLSHQVVQMSLSTASFELIRALDDGTFQFETIELAMFAAEQARLVEDGLTRIEHELLMRNEAHRREFRSIKFASLLADVSYPLQKVSVGDDDPGGAAFVLANVRVLEKALAAYRAELSRRGIGDDTYCGAERVLSDADYALRALAAYYARDSDSDIASSREADVFAFYTNAMFDQLGSLSRELDEEYERDGA